MTLPAAATVIVTEQLPDVNMHVFEENVIPFPETFDQVTVPVCDEYMPVTVAVQVIGVPMPKGDGVHDTAVVVDTFLIVSVVVRELP